MFFVHYGLTEQCAAHPEYLVRVLMLDGAVEAKAQLDPPTGMLAFRVEYTEPRDLFSIMTLLPGVWLN